MLIFKIIVNIQVLYITFWIDCQTFKFLNLLKIKSLKKSTSLLPITITFNMTFTYWYLWTSHDTLHTVLSVKQVYSFLFLWVFTRCHKYYPLGNNLFSPFMIRFNYRFLNSVSENVDVNCCDQHILCILISLLSLCFLMTSSCSKRFSIILYFPSH